VTAVAAAVGPAARHRRSSRSGSRSSVRRLLPVLADLVVAIAVCFAGYRFAAGALQEAEARGVVRVLRWFGVGEVSDAVPGHILVFPAGREPILAAVTASCSAILSVVGLLALTLTVLRRRRQHAVAGLVVSVVAMLALNHLRLLGSTLAGLWWGDRALVLFHDWVGTLWNLAATLLGFLLLVWVTLPAPVRAEQDLDGRHTARRPGDWARPGLGYRLTDLDVGAPRQGVTATGLLHRYVLPRRVSRRLADRREAARIDYRIGHMPREERITRVSALAADGLGAHAASLLAVATYDEDPEVLDELAGAVAARQWEPVTGPDVAALRLWARGWLLGRAQPAAPAPPAVPPAPPRLAWSGAERPPGPVGPRPRTFARPALPPLARSPEDVP
jgi:exosortase/archaeosortase family protein